jgi:MFS transporter, AAHS family, 3-hydroxyphenylpropionic acid transporter
MNISRSDPAPLYAQRPGIALAICTGAALVEGFDNQSMGVAGPRVIAEFGLSAAQAGVVFSAATIGLFLGAATGGRLADLWGRKRTLGMSLLIFGICSLATALSDGPKSLFAARLITGIGLGGAMPNFISLSSESAHPDRRISAVTLVMAGMPFGGAIAACVALGAHWGWSWHSIFYAGGVAPILLAALLFYVLPDASRPRVDGRPAAERLDKVTTVLFGGDRARTTLLLWIAFFFTQLILLLMLNWLPSLVKDLGFTRDQASMTSICFNLAGSLGAGLLGLLHAGEKRRRWVAVTYTGMALALAALASVGSNFVLAALACALAGIFIVGAQLVLFALAPLYYATPIRGTGVGAAVALGRLGSVVGPLFAGGLLAGGGGSAAVLLAIVPFVAIGGSAAFALTWRKQCEFDAASVPKQGETP